MGELNTCIETLLLEIRNSEEYLEYKRQEELLGMDPGLKARVDQFRAANFRLQEEMGKDDLFAAAEKLAGESVHLRRNSQVNAYLDAELALCRLLQKVCRRITEGIDMHVPPL